MPLTALPLRLAVRRSGATILELLLVLGFIAVLSGAVLTGAQRAKVRSAEAVLRSDARRYALLQELQVDARGAYALPAALHSAGPVFSTHVREDSALVRDGLWYLRVRYGAGIAVCEASSVRGDFRVICGEVPPRPMPQATFTGERIGDAAGRQSARGRLADVSPRLAARVTEDVASQDTSVHTHGPQAQLAGLALDASASVDPTGDSLVSYTWTYRADSAGTAWVTLDVLTRWGAAASRTRRVEDLLASATDAGTDAAPETAPANELPQATFHATPTPATAGQPVRFDATGSLDPDGYITDAAWAFGDAAHASGIVAQHTYALPGTYAATLTVTDDHGAVATMTQPVLVLASPVPAIVVGTATPLAFDPVRLDASTSTSPNGAIVSWAWDFGDSTTGHGATLDKTWTAPGTYPVRLTVVDERGATASVVREVMVTPQWIPVPSPFVCDDWQLVQAECVGENQVRFYTGNAMAWFGIAGAPPGDNAGPTTYSHPISQQTKTYWVDKTVSGVTVRFEITALSDAPPGSKLTLHLDWHPSCAGCDTSDFTVEMTTEDTQAQKLPVTMTIFRTVLYELR